MDSLPSPERPVIALVTAGGNGLRMHADRPKQFIEVNGSPVIIHTLKTLEAHADISAIYVVCAPEWMNFVRDESVKAGISKLRDCYPAGRSGVESICNGVMGLKGRNERTDSLLLVHESVRPLLSEKAITENILVARKIGNAVTAIQSNEAYLYSPDGLSAVEKVARESLYRVQMPQTFGLDFLCEIFSETNEHDLLSAQSLFTFVKTVRPDYRFNLARGEMINFKITYPEDLQTIEALLAYSSRD